ncbi:MAG: acyltransferase family protein [Chitinophagaceae bacterium]
MLSTDRRYDVDWLRVIAIALLLVYHTSIGFQPWGFMLGFITNDKPIELLWIPMAMLNIWRIPLLFFVSGMGVYFAFRNRSLVQLLRERVTRILVPFLAGTFIIVPVQILIVQHYYHQPLSYIANPAHLWFLGNIFVYVLLLLPVFFYVKKNEKNIFISRVKLLLTNPLCLLVVIAAFIAEALLVAPVLYELYAMTWHGFFLGLLAFFFGFCFALGGAAFSRMLMAWRWLFLTVAIALYLYRVLQVQMKVHDIQLVIESNCWIFSAFAFGYKYLNHPGKVLHYLSEAAYPVYIVHMIFLYLVSVLIFPLHIDVHLKFILVLLLTVAGCFALYEFGIRRINVVRLFFGLKKR